MIAKCAEQFGLIALYSGIVATMVACTGIILAEIRKGRSKSR